MGVFDSKIFAYAVVSLVVAAVVSPVITSKPKDSYPLSTYPMFARNRSRTGTVVQAVAVRTDGTISTLGPKYLGTVDVLQAESTLTRAAKKGADSARHLCGEIAARVAERGEPENTREIRIRRLEFDTVDWFVDPAAATKSEHIVARCTLEATR